MVLTKGVGWAFEDYLKMGKKRMDGLVWGDLSEGHRVVGGTEYTELQPLLSGVHSVMRVKSVLAGEGGGCTPTPSHYIYPHQ